MDLHAKYRNQLYQEQNIQLRKQVREIDLLLAQSNKKEEQGNSHSCVFLVLGPTGSGKTSLLQSLQFALNGSQGWGRTRRGPVTSFQIKRGAKWQVQGVKEVKQTERKYTVLGLQLNTEDKPCSRYKRALQYVDSGFQGCMQKGGQLGSRSLARVCLVCLDATADLAYEELTYLRFLKVDLSQRHIKMLFLLTKSDKKNLVESEKCIWLENKIWQVMKDLEIKDRDDVIIIENYRFPEEKGENHGKIALSSFHSTKIESNEQINYYSLQLLLRIINQTEKAGKWYNKSSKSWICGWT